MQAFLFEIEDFSTNRRFVKGTSFIGIHSEESKILGSLSSTIRYSFEMHFIAFLSKSKIWGKIEKKITIREEFFFLSFLSQNEASFW
jgi:hypothetical protein